MDILEIPYKKFNHHNDCLAYLEQEGCKPLGWLNSGIQIPDHYRFETFYKNWSGSYTIMVDPIHRVYYCVDMGD